MDIGIVSMRYAKALMEYAKSTGTEDRLYTEMRTLSRSFRKHPDLRAALENPVLPVQEKFSLICTAAVGDAPVGQELSRFVTLILKNRREAFLQYICLSYLDLYRKSRHIGVAKLTTAVPVSREIWEHRKCGSVFMTVLPPCCMPAWSCRLKWIPPLKADLYSTSTISVWMPVLLPS